MNLNIKWTARNEERGIRKLLDLGSSIVEVAAACVARDRAYGAWAAQHLAVVEWREAFRQALEGPVGV